MELKNNNTNGEKLTFKMTLNILNEMKEELNNIKNKSNIADIIIEKLKNIKEDNLYEKDMEKYLGGDGFTDEICFAQFDGITFNRHVDLSESIDFIKRKKKYINDFVEDFSKTCCYVYDILSNNNNHIYIYTEIKEKIDNMSKDIENFSYPDGDEIVAPEYEVSDFVYSLDELVDKLKDAYIKELKKL